MKKLYIFALVAMLFAACTTDETQDIAVNIEAPDTLVGTFEGDDSRIQLNEAQKTVWTKDDLVSVFYRSNANQKWQYQGETGERTGNLKRVANAEGTQELSNIVVVYPYNENYYINPKTNNVQASLPAVQTYLKDSYGLDGNIMVSQSEYNQFSLKNVCGWLKIQLTGNGEKVQSIKLKGNNGEQVAGEIYINSADATSTLASEMGGADDGENSAGGNLVFDDTILTEVVLNCGEGVTLSSEATAFYIALPPQTFEKGLTIEILATDGSAMTKSTNKEIIINRNAIQPMARFEFSTPEKIEYMATAVDIIWNYVDDANSDAGFEYTSRNLPLRISTTNSNISGYDYEQVVSNGLLQKVEVSCNGQLLSDIVSRFGGTNAAPTLHLSRFQWGKTYNISAIYILNGCEIEINATVKTIDRNRRVISIELADESVNIANSLTFTTNSESLPQRISNYAHELSIGNMTIEEYLKENLSTKWGDGMFSYASLANGLQCPNSKLTIYSSGQYVRASYSYTDFAATPSVLNYVCNITTWYGQEIQIRKNIYINRNLGLDFMHRPEWVYANPYYSIMLPYYNYNSPYNNDIKDFNLKCDLSQTFVVVDGNGTILNSQNLLAEQGIVARFEIEDTNPTGCLIQNYNRLIQNGKMEYVNVRGRLFMLTGIGEEMVEIPTASFSAGGCYYDYKVYGYNPIENQISRKNDYFIILEKGNYRIYETNIWESLSLKDKRGNELIDSTNGGWIIGDGTNGFATNVVASDVYGLNMTFELESVPSSMANTLSLNNTTGVLSINYQDDSLLQSLIVITVKARLSSRYGPDLTLQIPVSILPNK